MINNIALKTVNELSAYSFFIPAYQRGYRWTEQEVEDLLNDINDFIPKEIAGKDDKTWYCLQPVVVKKREDNSYEVIDGQQRLTTIYLILLYLNQDYIESRRDKLFILDYETRKESKEFLLNPVENNSNIDFAYISNAYDTINKWFDAKEQDINFDKNNFRSKLKFSAKVIWYECAEENTINVFTRLNIGKINLTNSELIKALFLNSSNFSLSDERALYLRQLEIANEWDYIENQLQNDRFWYFLCNEDKNDNRIEFIFDLMSNNSSENVLFDKYFSFRFFYNKLKQKNAVMLKDNWETVQAYFQRFYEWYHNRELYHKIGYILSACKTDIDKLYKNSSTLKKSEFLNFLNTTICNTYKQVNLSELEYGNAHTKDILLLYNILTLLQNENDFSYFPFDVYKKNKWNIEHITSRKDSDSIPKESRESWLKDVMSYIDHEQEGGIDIISRAEALLKESEDSLIEDEKFYKLFEEIIDHFDFYIKNREDIDYISNLTLLDEKTNKSYKNAVFPLKRKYIIELDKKGGFVPVCTKNVFLKYFSDYPPKISFWTDDDRIKYEEDLKRVLKDYLVIADE